MKTKIFRLQAITTLALTIAIIGAVNSVEAIAVNLKPAQKIADITQLNQANQYTFTDPIRTTQIVFFPQAPGPLRVDDPPGASQLIYRSPSGQELIFRGKNIRKQKSPLGLLITVTLEPNFDQGQLELTLVLPNVNLENGQKRDFDTVAIQARGLGRVRNPAQDLTYLVLPLKGVAQNVPLAL
jgi:hypothetical protein